MRASLLKHYASSKSLSGPRLSRLAASAVVCRPGRQTVVTTASEIAHLFTCPACTAMINILFKHKQSGAFILRRWLQDSNSALQNQLAEEAVYCKRVLRTTEALQQALLQELQALCPERTARVSEEHADIKLLRSCRPRKAVLRALTYIVGVCSPRVWSEMGLTTMWYGKLSKRHLQRFGRSTKMAQK